MKQEGWVYVRLRCLKATSICMSDLSELFAETNTVLTPMQQVPIDDLGSRRAIDVNAASLESFQASLLRPRIPLHTLLPQTSHHVVSKAP